MNTIPDTYASTTSDAAAPAYGDCNQADTRTSQECTVRISFIDVGKGDCILIQAKTSAVLIDAGYSATSDEVLAYLRGLGVSRLKCLIITHYDRDHIGGLRTIGSALPIDTVFLPDYVGADKNYRALMKAIEELSLPVQRVAEKMSLELGAAQLTIIPSSVPFVPDAHGDEGNDNDLSLAVSMVCGQDSYLFTGDLEKDGIAAFRDGGTCPCAERACRTAERRAGTCTRTGTECAA